MARELVWCSGKAFASYARGPVFESQRVQLFFGLLQMDFIITMTGDDLAVLFMLFLPLEIH